MPKSSVADLLKEVQSYKLLLTKIPLITKSANVLHKPSSNPVWETPNLPLSIKCMVSAPFFRMVSRTRALAIEVLPSIRKLEGFLFSAV